MQIRAALLLSGQMAPAAAQPPAPPATNPTRPSVIFTSRCPIKQIKIPAMRARGALRLVASSFIGANGSSVQDETKLKTPIPSATMELRTDAERGGERCRRTRLL